MVAQLGQLENYSVCSEMNEVGAVTVVWDATATPSDANCPHRVYWILSRGSSFMRGLVVVQDEGWAVLRSLTNKTQDMTQIAGTRVYIYPFFLPTPRFSFPPILNTLPAIKSTASILNYLDITWLAQNDASHSNTHSITYTTLYVHSVLPSTTFKCIIMLALRM